MKSSETIRPLLLIIVAHVDLFFLHRVDIARAAKQQLGCRVAVAAVGAAQDVRLLAEGFEGFELPLTRGISNPFSEIGAVMAIRALIRRIDPGLVHAFTLKCVLHTALATRIGNFPPRVFGVTGLGYLFAGEDIFRKTVRTFLQPFLRWSMDAPRTRTLFQNKEDGSLFIKNKIVSPEKTVLIRGSGADTALYLPNPEPPEPVTVLMPARMIYDKGVGLFVEAARKVKAAFPDTRFILSGGLDSQNPTAVPEQVLRGWQKEKIVEWMGNCKDMPRAYRECHIVCLPTLYREGIPRALIEAAASARPLVASDVPGCNDIVAHDYNGFLFPKGNLDALVEALLKLVGSREMRNLMGARGRRRVEEEFDLKIVQEQTLAVYRDLGFPEKLQ